MVEPKKVKVSKMVIDRTKHAIKTYKVTICLDGWTDTNSCPLLNVKIVCLVGNVFLGSIDTTGERKDIAYTMNTTAQYIEEVGPKNIVQLCMYNTTLMTGALKSLHEKYLHMYL